jgi:hypothetical protein
MQAPMDKSRLAAAVYKRTGFPLDPGDPAFALVELNRQVLEAMIEESASRLAERLDTLPERIRSSGTSVAAEVASQGMQRVVEMLAESRRTIASDAEQAQRRIADHTAKLSEPLANQIAEVVRAAQTLSRWSAIRTRWLLAAMAIGIMSCTSGFIGGQVAGTHDLWRLSAGR